MFTSKTTRNDVQKRGIAMLAIVWMSLWGVTTATAETCAVRTGTDATLLLPADVLAAGLGNEGGTLRVVSAEGACFGEASWDGASAVAVTVWGDDPTTLAVDGFAGGDRIRLRFTPAGEMTALDLLTSYDLEAAFVADGIYTAASLSRGLQLAVRVLLQGAYDASRGVMNTHLSEGGVLPATQPFADQAFQNTALAYTEPVAVTPAAVGQGSGVVDYVLVELRTALDAAAAARRVGLLRADGQVVATDGTSPLQVPVDPATPYHVVVRHRNHLGAVSRTAVQAEAGVLNLDFSTSATVAEGNDPQVKIGDGVYALYAGDANANGQIQNSDNFLFWWPSAGLGGYLSGDFNLNGQVQNSDKFLYWWPNAGRGSSVD